MSLNEYRGQSRKEKRAKEIEEFKQRLLDTTNWSSWKINQSIKNTFGSEPADDYLE